VSGRGALRMLLALILSVHVVFLLSDLGGLGMSYLWFCEIWIGYGLMASGLLLLLELAVEDKTLALISIDGAAIALVLLEWTVNLRLIGRTMALAKVHGALSAVLSIVAGLVGFVRLARESARRLEKSNLAESVSE
jgi:hypothetical protein